MPATVLKVHKFVFRIKHLELDALNLVHPKI